MVLGEFIEKTKLSGKLTHSGKTGRSTEFGTTVSLLRKLTLILLSIQIVQGDIGGELESNV